jgi:hypothetical protein
VRGPAHDAPNGDVYTNEGAETLIRRVLRGDAATITEQIRGALLSPDTIRRVFIVTSSLSRGQLEQMFAALSQTTKRRGNIAL